MNISNHALMRYAQRSVMDFIIDENSFQRWKRDNDDHVKELEIQLQNMYQNATLKMNTTNNKGKTSYYAINLDKRWIFVYEDQVIKTCYKLQYNGMSQETSNTIINALIKEYSDQKPKIDSIELQLEQQEHSYKEKVENIDNEIHLLNKKIDLLNQEKKIEKEKLESNKIELDNEKFELSRLVSRIVKPEYFL